MSVDHLTNNYTKNAVLTETLMTVGLSAAFDGVLDLVYLLRNATFSDKRR
jgi:hypothetical protein